MVLRTLRPHDQRQDLTRTRPLTERRIHQMASHLAGPTNREDQQIMSDLQYDASMIDHDARMLFDQLMQDLTARGIDARDALAAVRRIAKDGNGWQ